MSSPATFATPELIQSIFGDALTKFTSSILCKICLDYNLDFKELSEKYMDCEEAMSFFTTSQTHEVQNGPKPEKKPREPKPEKKPKEEKRPCAGQTSQGACKFAAMAGKDLCGIHQRKADGIKTEKKPREPKEPKEPKKAKKAPAPNHTHTLTEESEDCQLCDTHGNILDAAVTEAKYEAAAGGVSIHDRLKAILDEADEEEEVEKAEEPEEPEKVAEPEFTEEEVAYRTKVNEALVTEKATKKTFIRPKMRGAKKTEKVAEPKPEDVASTSAAEPEKAEELDLRDKLRLILANANGEDSESEEDSVADYDDEELKERLTAKLALSFGEEEDEIDLEQMCDSPNSQHRMREAWADAMSDEDEE
jgi:hypothetical protein